ncbi:MAG: phosphate signaling complex protein PhoU [Synechococcales cyanobacterium]
MVSFRQDTLNGQIKCLQQDVLRMGSLVESSVILAYQALFEGRLGAIDIIDRQDKQIDQFYRRIELDCIKVISTQAPVSQDLRMISTLMQLIRDLERIGDYAQDLVELALRMGQYTPPPEFERVKAMMQRCQAMLNHSLIALIDLDAEKGLHVKHEDDDVDRDYKIVYDSLAQRTHVQGSLEPLLLLLLMIRHIERMADHSTNIGRRVAYIVTGQR